MLIVNDVLLIGGKELNTLTLQNLLIEYQKEPIGLDCKNPRFCWELSSDNYNVKQTAYEITVYKELDCLAGTGKLGSNRRRWNSEYLQLQSLCFRMCW